MYQTLSNSTNDLTMHVEYK